jgi:hypothetical protein
MVTDYRNLDLNMLDRYLSIVTILAREGEFDLVVLDTSNCIFLSQQ